MSTVWQETVSLGENYSNIASHNTFPASAAAFTGQGNNNTVFGRIDVFGKDGEKVEKAGVKKDGTKVEYMDWHPQKKILAAGWSNGSVTIWNDSEQTVKVSSE